MTVCEFNCIPRTIMPHITSNHPIRNIRLFVVIVQKNKIKLQSQ